MITASAALLCAALTVGGQTAEASESRVEIVQFTADWCGPCKQMAPTVRRLQESGMPIRQINIDRHRPLAVRAKVKGIPCFIAVADNREVGRIERAASEQELRHLYQQAVSQTLPGPAAPQANSVVRGQSNQQPANQQPANQQPANQQPAGQQVTSPPPSAPAYSTQLGSTTSPPTAQPVAYQNQMPAAPVQSAPPAATEPANHSVAGPETTSAMRATVRLKIIDDRGHSFGTGTIIDVHGSEALVLTCAHIFRASQGKGRIECDLFGTDAATAKEIPGKLISYDMRRDVALVSLHPNIPVHAARVAGTGYRPQEQDPVFSVGCDRGAEPTVIASQIAAVNRYHGPPNLVVRGRPVDGRSGGGLFNSDGMLVGVCNAADQELDEGLYAALGNIHAELDNAGLGFVYRHQDESLASRLGQRSNEAAQSSVTAPRRAIPEREPGQPTTPTSATAPKSTARPAQTAEVICIIRKPGQSLNDTEVLVLDRPSDGFLDSLSKEINRRGPHVATESRVGNE